jgi:hypothetical protein
MESALNSVTPELRIAHLDKLARGEKISIGNNSLDWLFCIIVVGSQTFFWTMYFYEKQMEQQKLFYEKMLKEHRLMIAEIYQELNN